MSGTAGNDTFNAASGTFGGDTLVDSKAGTDSDTLNATVTVNTTAATVANIENLNVTGKFTVTGLNFANVTNAQTATFSTAIAGGTATVTNVKDAAVDKIVAGSNITNVSITTDATTGIAGKLVVDAGSATTVSITGAAASGENVDLKVSGTVAVNNVGGAIEAMTLSGATDSVVTLDAIGTSLTVAGTKNVTVASGALTGETIKNTLTGDAKLTLVNTSASANVDLSKAESSLIKTGVTLGANTLTVANGAKVEVSANLGNVASTIASDAATASTNAVDVTFTTVATQTGVVFSNIKTANIVAAAPAVTGTDLTFAVLNNGTNDIKLSGSNDVVVTAGTAKNFDASGLTGKLTYTQAAGDVATTVKGAADVNTVIFTGTTTNSTFVGQNANSNVTFVTLAGTASATGGSGNDVISATGAITGSLNAELGDGANVVTANATQTGTINVVAGEGADVVNATGLTGGVLAGSLGGGNDTVTVATVGAGLSAAGVVSMDLGAGNDTITVKTSGAVAATIVVDGGAGTDTFAANAASDFSAATLSLSNIEKIAIASGSNATFSADQISGKSYTIEGGNNGESLIVTAATATAGKTIDLSTLTLDNTVTKAISATTITGSNFADTITGTNGADTINGGTGADTIVFAATATANGSDIITVVSGAGGDILNFSKFLSGGTVEQNGGTNGAIFAYSSAATSDVAIANKVVLLADATGGGVATAVDAASEIAGLVNGTGNVFSITAGGKAIVVAGESTGVAAGYVYFVNDANADGTLAGTEVALVGTMQAGTDIDTFLASNFALV